MYAAVCHMLSYGQSTSLFTWPFDST